MKTILSRVLIAVALVWSLSIAATSNAKRIIIKKPQKSFIRLVVIDSGLDLNDTYVKDKLCKDLPYKDFTDSGIADTVRHGSLVLRLIVMHAGSSPYCITVLKYYDPKADMTLTGYRFVQAMLLVAKLKPDMVNVSAGGSSYNETEHSVIKYSPKTLWIAAAGNNNEDLTKVVNTYYPASYALDPTIKNIRVVGALDEFRKKLDCSNYGDVVKYWELGKYPEGQGTSYAAPVITGKLIHMFTHPKVIEE